MAANATPSARIWFASCAAVGRLYRRRRLWYNMIPQASPVCGTTHEAGDCLPARPSASTPLARHTVRAEGAPLAGAPSRGGESRPLVRTTPWSFPRNRQTGARAGGAGPWLAARARWLGGDARRQGTARGAGRWRAGVAYAGQRGRCWGQGELARGLHSCVPSRASARARLSPLQRC